MSKYGVFSGPYFSLLRTRNNSVFGQFLRSEFNRIVIWFFSDSCNFSVLIFYGLIIWRRVFYKISEKIKPNPTFEFRKINLFCDHSYFLLSCASFKFLHELLFLINIFILLYIIGILALTHVRDPGIFSLLIVFFFNQDIFLTKLT